MKIRPVTSTQLDIANAKGTYFALRQEGNALLNRVAPDRVRVRYIHEPTTVAEVIYERRSGSWHPTLPGDIA